MAKQTFTTGQVLTAAQMTSLQQTAMGGGSATAKTASYTLVAADAGTTIIMNSGSATTITVNTGLFAAGDTVFVVNQGAGVCTITAGTATVSTAGSLAMGANETGQLYFLSASAAIFSEYTQTAGGGGKVLQVVQATTATSVNITTTAFSDTGLSGTITPTSATSKVLVMTMQGYKAASGGAGCNAGISLVRGATDILVMGSNGVALGANATGSTSVGVRGIASLHYLDSPATTSATTYKTQGRLQTSGGGNEIEFQVAGLMTSTIILMEIGA
jgi:hypothetical protein